jgi:DNA repair exonuclease SbcCD ATPase subunit
MRKFLFTAGVAYAAQQNPIRKVVMLLQNMQKEVEAEGEKEKDLFEKFMCYCKKGTANLEKEAAEAADKIEAMSAQQKSGAAEKAQLEQETAQHKSDRAQAKQDAKTADELRAKEKGEYEAEKADSQKNLDAMGGALTALEKGLGGAFLQTKAAKVLKNTMQESSLPGREQVLALLEQGAPGTSQIVGILKQMEEDLQKSYEQNEADEASAVDSYQSLKAAKQKEIQAATDAIESKTTRIGKLAVDVVNSQNAAKDATRELADAQKFISELKEDCATKDDEWAARQKSRAGEVSAISEAITVLNDDDALDTFNKSLPKPKGPQAVAFLQRTVKSSKALRAATLMKAAVAKAKNPAVSLLAATIQSKLMMGDKSGKVDFGSVLKMIDDMVALLGTE